MNKCNCSAGSPAPASNYNRATNCQQDICSLHTVVIPKSKGSDAPGQPYAPKLGGYQNAIVTYEKTGAVYIFDEKGIFTNLTGSELVRMVETVQAQLQSLQQQVDENTDNLSKETQNRIQAQINLQNTLTALQQALTTETNARIAGDETLTNTINELQQRVITNNQTTTNDVADLKATDATQQEQINNLTTALATETANRENADNTIQESVNSLQTAVTDLDSKITDSLGKAGNLPDNLIQSAELNTDSEGSTVSLLTSMLDLETGESTSTSQVANFKTVNGESIVGEGDIEVSGGGADVVQETGTSTTVVMSQNAVTQELAKKIAGAMCIEPNLTAPHTTGLHVEVHYFNASTDASTGNGKLRHTITIPFQTTFTVPPVVVITPVLTFAANLPAVTDLPIYALTEVTTTQYAFRYGWPTGTEPVPVAFNMIAIGY